MPLTCYPAPARRIGGDQKKASSVDCFAKEPTGSGVISDAGLPEIKSARLCALPCNEPKRKSETKKKMGKEKSRK